MTWLCYLYQKEVEKRKKKQKRTKVNQENNNRRLLNNIKFLHISAFFQEHRTI